MLLLLLLLSLLPEYFLGGLALQSLVFGLAGIQRRVDAVVAVAVVATVVAVVVLVTADDASVSREVSVAAAKDRWSAPGGRFCSRRVL